LVCFHPGDTVLEEKKEEEQEEEEEESHYASQMTMTEGGEAR
jgi:hypothetical protein